MKSNVKMFPFEMKLNETKRTIEGYASTFGNKDQVGDIVEKGAFKKTLAERAQRVKVLWQHSEVIGKPLHMEEDSKGLYVEAYISKTSLGNDVIELVKDGVIDSMSIGYQVIKDKYDTANKSRLLKELKLHEFSLVTFPANEMAAITNVKTAQEFKSIMHKLQRDGVKNTILEGKDLEDESIELIRDTITALETILAALEPSGTDETDEPEDMDDMDDQGEAGSASASHSKGSVKPLIYKESDMLQIQQIIKNMKI